MRDAVYARAQRRRFLPGVKRRDDAPRYAALYACAPLMAPPRHSQFDVRDAVTARDTRGDAVQRACNIFIISQAQEKKRSAFCAAAAFVLHAAEAAAMPAPRCPVAFMSFHPLPPRHREKARARLFTKRGAMFMERAQRKLFRLRLSMKPTFLNHCCPLPDAPPDDVYFAMPLRYRAHFRVFRAARHRRRFQRYPDFLPSAGEAER